MTLKQCQPINKLEALLEHLYQRDIGDIDWVETSYQFGFSAQPHLIRYLKSQLGWCYPQKIDTKHHERINLSLIGISN
ncbi:hypothetical protein [Thalassomonas sp. RHCl1]|uniref:hypothetical protein n=1 Tax=Thalassomonas sp. RHCl1 TaxID=2995320 RepID=UPI0032B25B23